MPAENRRSVSPAPKPRLTNLCAQDRAIRRPDAHKHTTGGPVKMPICAPLPQRILAMVCVGLATHGTVARPTPVQRPRPTVFSISACASKASSRSVGSNSLNDVVGLIHEDELKKRFPGYEYGVSAGGFLLDVRGIPLTIGYERNTTILGFAVPSLRHQRDFRRRQPRCQQ